MLGLGIFPVTFRAEPGRAPLPKESLSWKIVLTPKS